MNMEPKTLSGLLKCIIIGTGLCGFLFYIHFMPFYAVAVVCATLSQLVRRAAALQEQSDWTI